jgi:hypothetical protein
MRHRLGTQLLQRLNLLLGGLCPALLRLESNIRWSKMPRHKHLDLRHMSPEKLVDLRHDVLHCAWNRQPARAVPILGPGRSALEQPFGRPKGFINIFACGRVSFLPWPTR